MALGDPSTDRSSWTPLGSWIRGVGGGQRFEDDPTCPPPPWQPWGVPVAWAYASLAPHPQPQSPLAGLKFWPG